MFISISYTCMCFCTIPSNGRLVNWFCHRLRAQRTIQSKSERLRHRLARHKCTIHNTRDAVTVSAAVATRSRAGCSSMEGHTSLSTALVTTGLQNSGRYDIYSCERQQICLTNCVTEQN